MKRGILLMIAVVLLVSSGIGVPLETLKPVEVLYLFQEGEELVLCTDTGDVGRGRNPRQAVENLKATTSGNLFLDTADQLVLTEDTAWAMDDLWDFLRPATEVCMTLDSIDPETVAPYLTAHSPGVTILDVKTRESALPILRMTEERYWFEGEADF